MKLTNLGQCGFLIEAQGVRLVTDPYLSCSIDENHKGDPDWTRNYAPPCDLMSLKPDGVLISHSHDDHMDPRTLEAYRSAGGDCRIAAPAPECALLEKLGFSDIVYARAEQRFSVESIDITPILCAHTEPHADELGRFRELSYLIFAEGKCMLFGGDLSIYDGLRERVAREQVDYAILPCNGRDEIRTANNIIGNTDCREAAELAKGWGAVLIPSHYDLYNGNCCPAGDIRDAAAHAGVTLCMPGVGECVEL